MGKVLVTFVTQYGGTYRTLEEGDVKPILYRLVQDWKDKSAKGEAFIMDAPGGGFTAIPASDVIEISTEEAS